jgi:hypothetical protein
MLTVNLLTIKTSLVKNKNKRRLFVMPLNKGYLTAKTDKASDETYTPAYAVKPLIKYV